MKPKPTGEAYWKAEFDRVNVLTANLVRENDLLGQQLMVASAELVRLRKAVEKAEDGVVSSATEDALTDVIRIVQAIRRQARGF